MDLLWHILLSYISFIKQACQIKKKLKVQYNITKFQFVYISILNKHNIHAYFYTISHLLIPYRLLIQKIG